MSASAETFSVVVGRVLGEAFDNLKQSRGAGVTGAPRYVLVWLGAFTFLYPMFIVHFVFAIEENYRPMELVGLFFLATIPSGLLAGLPCWLLASDSEGHSKVRLYLSGFLLPYAVVALIVPLLQGGGAAQ